MDNRANVASTVYVGPRAAVFGTSTVTGNARIEGLAWVNDGVTISGNVVVKDNAIVQGGANLSGNLVLGGDAEMWINCSSGTYLLYSPDRGCDGRGGESDVNPAYAAYTDSELAITTWSRPTGRDRCCPEPSSLHGSGQHAGDDGATACAPGGPPPT